MKKFLDGKAMGLLKKISYAIPNGICALFPMNDEIIFESQPDFTCNTYELYRYMAKQGLQRRYKLSWLVEKIDACRDRQDLHGDLIESRPKSLIEKIKKYFRCNRAKVFIGCNMHVKHWRTGGKQVNVYLNHGMAIKNCNGFVGFGNNYCGYSLVDGKFFAGQPCRFNGLDQEQVIVTGAPYTDQLYRKSASLQDVYADISDFDKVVAWVPTFRENMNKVRVDCQSNFPLGIPILYDVESVKRVNAFLVKNRVLLIMKPHPEQDLDVIKRLDVSNIRILKNEDLLKHNIQTNEFLAQTDAMIGDYSGIYFDYLLLNRPIGITLDDFELYKQQHGFAFDNILDILVGEHIYKVDDMIQFVQHLVDGQDIKKSEREEIKKKTHDFDDGRSAERVYRFIIGQMKQRGFDVEGFESL